MLQTLFQALETRQWTSQTKPPTLLDFNIPVAIFFFLGEGPHPYFWPRALVTAVTEKQDNGGEVMCHKVIQRLVVGKYASGMVWE